MTNYKHTGTNKLVFTSERLSYNPLAADDLDLIIDLWSDPDVVQFMGNTYSSTVVGLNVSHSGRWKIDRKLNPPPSSH